MSVNAQLIIILSALVVLAAGARVICGPIGKPDAHGSLYAAAKFGPFDGKQTEIEMAVSDTRVWPN